MRRITRFALVLAAATMFAGFGQRAHAQQAGGVAFEFPEIRNYVAVAAGVVPDYLGSDDYTVGAAPAGMIKFGSGERYARLLVTELSVNILDSKTWNFGPVLNYRLARDDVDDDAVDRMRDIDGAVEAGLIGSWSWIGDEDPRHRFPRGARIPGGSLRCDTRIDERGRQAAAGGAAGSPRRPVPGACPDPRPRR